MFINFWCFVDSCRGHFLVFGVFFLFVVLHDYSSLCSACVHLLVLLTIDFVAHFVVHVVYIHFALHLWHYQKITYLFCPVLCSFASMFVFLLFRYVYTLILSNTPLVPLLLIKMTPSAHHNYRWHILNLGQKCPSRLFESRFAMFLTLTIAIYPVVPICTHLHTLVYIFPNLTNMMSGEISPSIGSKLGLSWPVFTLLQCLCVLSCPLHLKTPIQTQSHLFTLIHPQLTFTCIQSVHVYFNQNLVSRYSIETI